MSFTDEVSLQCVLIELKFLAAPRQSCFEFGVADDARARARLLQVPPQEDTGRECGREARCAVIRVGTVTDGSNLLGRFSSDF